MPDFLTELFAKDKQAEQDEPVTATGIAFDIKKFVLQTLLEKAFTVIPSRDVMPVLKCFQFHLEPTRLRVVASDTVTSLIASTPMVTAVATGVNVFPARKLLDIIKSAGDDDVSIRVDGATATVTIGRARWTLKLLSGSDYPPMPSIEEAEYIRVGREDFLRALVAVRYAASRDPNRASLNIIDITDGKLTACDGARIQQIRISDFPINLRIPISAVDDVQRLLKISELDLVEVGQSEHKLIFRFGRDVYIVSKLRAAFPDMEAQMLRPALENRHDLRCERHDLVQAIKRVRINADTESSAIALDLTDGHITVSAKDKFNNTAVETIDARWAGQPRTVMLNHKYLMDLVTNFGGDTLDFKLGDDSRTRRTPLLLKGDDGAVGVAHQMNADWVA